MKIDSVIFDLGGVFINIDYQATINAFKELGFAQADHLYSQSEQAFLFQQYETGQISTPHFINKLLELTNLPISPNNIVKAWNAMLGEFDLESIQVLESLQGKKRLFMLSNTNELHWEIVKRKWNSINLTPIENYFEKIYLSHELGMRKPHPETFEAICKMNDLIPEKTLFIDDSIQHIEGAQKIGLQTIYLKTILDLGKEINKALSNYYR